MDDTELEITHCMNCGGQHLVAVMKRDRHGIAVVTRTMEPCITDLYDELADEAGRLFAFAVDTRDPELAEKACSALEVNDDPPGWRP
jgi:hypothetical protein